MLLNFGFGEDFLDCKEINPVNAKGKQSWIFTGRTDAETSIHWPPNVKKWLNGKDPDSGNDWRQEEKRTTEDEMVGWHHWLDEHEFEQAQTWSWWWTGKSGMLQSMGALNWTDALIWLSGASPLLCISELCDIPDLEFSIWWPTTHQIINGLNQIYLPGLCQRSHPILLHSIPNVGILFYLQMLDICLCSWSSFITYTIYILFPPMQIIILNFPRNIVLCVSDSKETACNGRDPGSVPGLGRCLDKGMATHSSILAWRLPMDRGAWQARVHGVTKSWTRWSDFTSLHVEIRECIGHRWYFEWL